MGNIMTDIHALMIEQGLPENRKLVIMLSAFHEDEGEVENYG